jgi:hypothetical protein
MNGATTGPAHWDPSHEPEQPSTMGIHSCKTVTATDLPPTRPVQLVTLLGLHSWAAALAHLADRGLPGLVPEHVAAALQRRGWTA